VADPNKIWLPTLRNWLENLNPYSNESRANTALAVISDLGIGLTRQA